MERPRAADDRRRLVAVLALCVTYFVIELLGGLYTNSLALLSDAFHLLTDIAAVGLSLFALWVASRPASESKTYGYLRAEILGALFNGLMLWVIALFIFIEALGRLRAPVPVHGPGMMVVASCGIAVNLAVAAITLQSRRKRGRLVMRSVFLHAISDVLSSAGVVIAGALVQFGGLLKADAFVSIAISCLIVHASWGLVRDGVDILMEAVPKHIDLSEVKASLLAVPGTEEVHDLHVWCLTSHELALSAHAVMAEQADSDRILAHMSDLLREKFNIHHMTVQLERDNRRETEPTHF